MSDTGQYPYLDMYAHDGSGIAVEHWRESWSVGMHRHEYYEVMMVNKGSCRHFFHGVSTLMIPGDVTLIPGHEAHGYELRGEISLYNCQFFPDKLDRQVISALTDAELNLYEKNSAEVSVWEDLLTKRERMHAESFPNYTVNNSKQGILHLSPAEHTYLFSLVKHTMDDAGSPLLKQKYMEVILLELKRAIQNQYRKYLVCTTENQKMIAKVLAEIEENLTEPFDIAGMARRYAFSPNHFRKIFKDITGLTPVQYINRLRMTQACECMERQGMSIKEASEYVGIYDLNYFSRMFKKVIGCTPNKMKRDTEGGGAVGE